MAREEAGLTLKELSDRCNALGRKTKPPTSASAPTINRWELGQFVPSAPRLALLAKALQVDVMELCAEQGSK